MWFPFADVAPVTSEQLFPDFRYAEGTELVVAIATPVVVFVGIVLVETLVLWAVARCSLLRTTLATLAANFVTVLIGLGLLAAGLLVRGEPELVRFLVMFVVTVVFEAFVLRIVLGGGVGRIVKMLFYALAINLASYAIIGALIFGRLLR